ncbi:MAG: hypothetical protein ACRD4E_13560 [Bryobacteraceae bacterium]
MMSLLRPPTLGVLCAGLLAACGGSAPNPAGAPAASGPEDKVLNVYNW